MASLVRRGEKWRARYRDSNGKEFCRHFERKIDAQLWLKTTAGDKPIPVSAQSLQRSRRPPAPQDDPRARVYYVQLGDMVKIGTTINLTARLGSLYPAELLVTERGGVELERRRHREFAELRVKYEWFRYEGALVTHVERLTENLADFSGSETDP